MEQTRLDAIPKITPKQLTNTKFRADVEPESSEDQLDDQNIDDETPKNIDEY